MSAAENSKMSEGDQRGAERGRSLARQLRPAGIGGLAAVLLVVLVMGTASAAPAVTTATTTKDVAPYAGIGLGTFGNYASGCGSTAAVSTLPFFNTTNGVGKLAAKTTSKNCGTVASNRTIQVSVEYVSPEFTTTTGSHNVTATWSLTFTGKLAATGTTSDPSLAVLEVLVYTFLDDTSNSTTLGTVAAAPAAKEITSGTYSHTFSKVTEKVSLVRSLVKGQSYEFAVEVLVLLSTSVAPGGTSASASVTMAGGSDGATLKSVTVA